MNSIQTAGSLRACVFFYLPMVYRFLKPFVLHDYTLPVENNGDNVNIADETHIDLTIGQFDDLDGARGLQAPARQNV